MIEERERLKKEAIERQKRLAEDIQKEIDRKDDGDPMKANINRAFNADEYKAERAKAADEQRRKEKTDKIIQFVLKKT